MIKYPRYEPFNEVDVDIWKRGIEERKQIMTKMILDTDQIPLNFDHVPIYIANNISFPEEILVNEGKKMVNTDKPDFSIVNYIRILYQTDKYDDISIDAIKKVPLWITKGEKEYIYWSENHNITFTVSAYLLRQKYKDRFPVGYFDDGIDSRINWILKSKQESHLFEFNSPVYTRITLMGLLLLYDFAEDENVKENAKACISRVLRDWLAHTNSVGAGNVSSGRTYQDAYYKNQNLFGIRMQQLIFLITGLGPDMELKKFVDMTTSPWIVTSLDFTSLGLAEAYTAEEMCIAVDIGATAKDLAQLSNVNRQVVQLTMGSYFNENYYEDCYHLFKRYDLFNHNSIQQMKKIFQGLIKEKITWTTLAKAGASFSRGSLLKTKLITYKYDEVVLTSCEKYFPGYKGYQQMQGMALIKDTCVFTYSMIEDNFTGGFKKNNNPKENEKDPNPQVANNNQLPFLVQKENVQVALYNPNADLIFATGISKFRTDVLFYMNLELFEDPTFRGKWVFARNGNSYVAVHRHMLNDDKKHIITVCKDDRQAWITVVGNNKKHGSYQKFIETIESSKIDIDLGTKNVIALQASIDGQNFEIRFERNGTHRINKLIEMLKFKKTRTNNCLV